MPERLSQLGPERNDVAVRTAPLVHQTLEVRVVALGSHRPERPDAAVVPQREGSYLALLAGQVAHTRRRLDVDVTPGLERLERPRLASDPRQHTRFDSRVVHHGERAEEHGPHERLEGVGTGTEPHRHVESLRLDGGVQVDPRLRLDGGRWQVLELDSAPGPAARVGTEVLERSTEAVVRVDSIQRGNVLLARDQGQLLAEFQHAPLVGGQIVPGERLRHGRGFQVGEVEPGGGEPRLHLLD